MVELMQEICKLGQEVNPNKFVFAAKVMELAGVLQSDVEIPDEVFASMDQEMRKVALAGFIAMFMQGLSTE